MATDSPQETIVELCRQFYALGWVTGTGGGIGLRRDGRVYLAPSGVQKERIAPEDIYVFDEEGQLLGAPADARLRPSECAPLFDAAFRMRDAGAVIHSHGIHAMLASLVCAEQFECTEIEMIKGIEGHGYYDRLVVPIIENTAREAELRDRMVAAIEAHPRTCAVLVRRHGVYVWGRDWIQAKTQAECYHYLFEAAVRMKQLGLDPARGEGRAPRAVGGQG
jgi:methylthioribulose-1-phosphate dehydratase